MYTQNLSINDLKIKIINNKINWNFAVASPQSGFSPTESRWNLEMLVFMEGEKPENLEKNHQGKDENNKLNPHTCMTLGSGIEPGPQWWEASALTTEPSLLLKKDIYSYNPSLNNLQ